MAIDIRIPKIEAIVNIDGKEMNFVRLRISQEMGEHHDFEVLVDFETFDESFHESPEIFMQKTNTKVVIDLQHADKPETAYIFSGIVTNIRMIAEDGMHGGILFIGKSNTIELERGEMMQTYSNTNLIEMLRTVTGSTMNLDTDVDPDWKADIDFAIQYRESDWSFLQRICNQYKERMYYTGTDLLIGSHPEFPTINLTYDMELRSFEMCSRLVPNQFSTYYYKREEHATLHQDSPDSIENATNLLDIVGSRSDNLTIFRRPNTPTPAYIPDMDSLIEYTKRQKVTEGAKMMYCRGEAKTCDVRIGRIISVQMPEKMGGADLGKFRVYNIVHEFDQNGRYKCEFEAIPADLEYIPIKNVPIPVPNLIEATVWNNEDPLGIGRVRVEFPFDEKDCETWIPVMTPDAGGNGHGLGPVSRGYHFIPEKNDRVVISFLDGPQLAHPVVVGSMFHGANAAVLGGGKGNHIKTIRDKSSGEFIMNTDEGGDWGITIKDRRGNIIHVDTRGQNINITAPETVTISAKNIVLNAEENIESQAGIDIISTASNDMVDYAGNDLKQTAKCEILENSDTRTELVDQEYVLQSFSIDSLAREISIFSEEENMTLQSGKVVKINSAEKTNQF